MGKAVPRKQHFVPKVYLRQFADANENLYVYTVNGGRKSHIKNVACERDFNEYAVGLERTEYRYEALFEKFESFAGPITKKLLTGLSLDYQECLHWAIYLSCLFFRTRKIRRDYGATLGEGLLERTFSEPYLRNLQFTAFQHGQLYPFKDIRDAVKEQFERIRANPAYLHLKDFHTRLPTHAMCFVGRNWLVANDDSQSLITNDAPVCSGQIHGTLLSLGHGLALPETFAFLALSPGKLFMSVPPGASCFALNLSRETVNVINHSLVRLADREVFSRREQPDLLTTVKNELGQIKFGVDAFRMPEKMSGIEDLAK